MTAVHTAPQNTSISSTTKAAPVWRVAAVATICAAVATETVAAIARSLDVSMKAGKIGATSSERIPTGGFASLTLMLGAIGVLLAVAFARWAKRPARTYTVVTVCLTAMSFIPSLAAGHTSGGTKAVLCLGHIVAAAIIIPTVAKQLSRIEARSTR
jgi:hypothetical protein